MYPSTSPRRPRSRTPRPPRSPHPSPRPASPSRPSPPQAPARSSPAPGTRRDPCDHRGTCRPSVNRPGSDTSRGTPRLGEERHHLVALRGRDVELLPDHQPADLLADGEPSPSPRGFASTAEVLRVETDRPVVTPRRNSSSTVPSSRRIQSPRSISRPRVQRSSAIGRRSYGALAFLARHGLLRHDAHLLRERGAAPRARLHDDRGRHPRPPPPPARGGRVLPHGHRRARRAGRAGRRARGDHAAGARRPQRPALPGPDAAHQRVQRLLHPHLRPAHKAKVQEVMQRVHDNGHVYTGLYEGWYCPSCADFKTENEIGEATRARSTTSRSTASRRTTGSSRCPPSGPLERAVRRAPGPGHAAQPLERGARVHQRRPPGTSRSAARRSPGASRCRGTRRTSSTSGSTRCSTTSPRSPTPATART